MKWRPIHTAPEDEMVLLCYLGADQRAFTGPGRWVDVPHENAVNAALMKGDDLAAAKLLRQPGHWEVAGIAIQEHYPGSPRSFKPTSFYARPTHWMPLPAPAKGCYKRWFQLSPTLQ